MITAVTILIAAFFNAVMDRTGDVVAFRNSVFRHKNIRFWSKEISWAFAKKIFGWKFDAWHIAKSAMITLLIAGAVLYRPVFNPIPDFFIYGVLWNATFNLCYNKLLKSK